MASPAGQSLNVVALISGGKDSFFSLLHCIANGHRVVALANLHPASPAPPAVPPTSSRGADDGQEAEEVAAVVDLNSFMYQTVGHQVIPLYSEATGIPLYRQAIAGDAGLGGKDYCSPSPSSSGGSDDETESIVPLLRAVKAAHPEVNALCAGAILSTYQRTRVESVAVRLGLVPLAFLWKYPVLPLPGGKVGGDDARLLVDMAAAGIDARIVKVASGGLDESFLWENVACPRGVERLTRAMGRFGGAAAGQGAVIGEGGEFETLVVDGPNSLFWKRIVVEEEDREVVREGGGTAWLNVRNARLEEKTVGEQEDHDSGRVRVPDLLDARFESVLQGLDRKEEPKVPDSQAPPSGHLLLGECRSKGPLKLRQWCVVGDVQSQESIEAETISLVEKVQALLGQASLSHTAIISTVIALRRMSDFPTINKIYGSLFTSPNPPSRVTISCGDLLPSGCNIAVYLSVHHGLTASERQGLHVQSRSYWAPANIGPYSQAISLPISSLSTTESSDPASAAGLVHIAGQIPLIPATMNLPDGSATFNLQVTLSLQHLWRIGIETGVRWWSSAVAYLPRASSTSPAEKALLASRAWQTAHTWSPQSQEAEDEPGPDLWDLRFNPRYMSFARDEQAAGPKTLPDRAVLDRDNPSFLSSMPAFFAAEVQELPRQAGVEWHAHLGFAHLDDGSVSVVSVGSDMMQAQHTAVAVDRKGVFVHSVLAVKRINGQVARLAAVDVARELQTLYLARIAALAGLDTAKEMGDVAPTHLYVHTGVVSVSGEDVGRDGCPVIPCFSLWNAKGEEVTGVAVYQAWFERSDGGDEEL
jgi:diphthine-ammonia ligase